MGDDRGKKETSHGKLARCNLAYGLGRVGFVPNEI